VSTADLDAAAEPLRQELVQQLALDGLLSDPGWREAVAEIPRHWFTPGFYLDSGKTTDQGLTVWDAVTAESDPGRWLPAIYSDQSLITQINEDEADWADPRPRTGGAATSSSTLPSLVLRMWQDADLHDGQDVLEIGTGTGYSAALFSVRFDASHLTTVEVDQDRMGQAVDGLNRCRYAPRLAVADGLFGYAPYAPYDRIVAACSVRRIPGPWLRQTRPGGKILATLGGWLDGYARALVEIGPDGNGDGVLLPGTISFMPARADTRPNFGNIHQWAAMLHASPARPAEVSPTPFRESSVHSFHSKFIAQLAVPYAQLTSDGTSMYLVDAWSGSVAGLTPDGDRYTVREAGPDRLWSRVEDALSRWSDAGYPPPEEFRIGIRGGEQRITTPYGVSATLP
jgi:methyltransferase of ATP-grasp peptide maturase system